MKNDNICQTCKKEFKTTRRASKFCSERCRNADKYEKVKEMKRKLKEFEE